MLKSTDLVSLYVTAGTRIVVYIEAICQGDSLSVGLRYGHKAGFDENPECTKRMFRVF